MLRTILVAVVMLASAATAQAAEFRSVSEPVAILYDAPSSKARPKAGTRLAIGR